MYHEENPVGYTEESRPASKMRVSVSARIEYRTGTDISFNTSVASEGVECLGMNLAAALIALTGGDNVDDALKSFMKIIAAEVPPKNSKYVKAFNELVQAERETGLASMPSKTV